MSTYFGKLCMKHPALLGERRACNAHCVECHRERARRQYKGDVEGFKRRAAIWRKQNPEKRRAVVRRWDTKNPGYHQPFVAKRRARIRDALAVLTVDDENRIRALYREAQRRTAETGIAHDVDHDRPLSRGGKHHPDNMLVMTASMNRAKGARFDSTLDFILS